MSYSLKNKLVSLSYRVLMERCYKVRKKYPVGIYIGRDLGPNKASKSVSEGLPFGITIKKKKIAATNWL